MNPHQEILDAILDALIPKTGPITEIKKPDTFEKISMDAFYSASKTGQIVLYTKTGKSKISFTNEILTNEDHTGSASIILRDNISGHAIYIHIDPVLKNLMDNQKYGIKQVPRGILSAGIIEGVKTPYSFEDAIHEIKNIRDDVVVFNSVELPEKEQYRIVYNSKTDRFYIHVKNQAHAYKADGLDIGLGKKTRDILSMIDPQRIDLMHNMHR